jgi:glutamate carboxypeptidase
MGDKNLLSALRTERDELFALLKKLVEIESPSGDIEGIEQCAQIILNALKGVPADIKRTETELGPVIKIEITPGPSRSDKNVLILAHMDTIHPKGTIDTFPFAFDGNEMWGPGVFDMKGGLVEAIFALRFIAENADNLGTPVTLLCTPDEEIGSPASRQIIEKEALSSRCVFVPEPSIGPDGALKTSRSGKALYHLKIKGLSAHSGLDPLSGISAIKELAAQITDIYNIAREDEGLYINVGVARGGIAVNVVADYAEALIDVRLTRNDQMEYVEKSFNALKPKEPKITMIVDGGLERPPWEGDSNSSRLFEEAGKIGTHLGLSLTQKHAGGSSDGNFTAALGIPTLDGLGPIGSGAHSAGNEKILFNSIIERTALLTGLVMHAAANNSIIN